VSVDGHSWSNSAYATDFNEKLWPPNYGGHSRARPSEAYVPSSGHLWDLAKRKGLTYRSYGEYASRSSDGTTMEASAVYPNSIVVRPGHAFRAHFALDNDGEVRVRCKQTFV
jgi:hypothetical protein